MIGGGVEDSREEAAEESEAARAGRRIRDESFVQKINIFQQIV
jgi:hypothetical protein